MSLAVSAGGGAAPKRRADAERNRIKVIAAARELFVAGGDTVSMDEIARRAGVGIGTLYRHFPTKEALLTEASQQRFGEILTYYRTVCRETDEPIDALHLLLVHIGEVEERDWVFARVVEGTLGGGLPSEMQAELEVELVNLVGNGQASGSIRDDIAVTDIFSLTCGLATIVHRGSGDWRRYIDIMLDGLRSR